MTRFKDPWLWLRGLGASVIGGSAGAGGSWLGMAAAKSAGVDVPVLNLKSLGIILLSSALASLFMYLQKSPLPDIVTEETVTIKRESVDGAAPTVTTTQKTSVTTTDGNPPTP